MKRVLITTALEETWPTADVPVIFLGEWCKLYNRKHVWSKYDSITVPYHWDDRKKLYNDYIYLQGLYEKVLSQLATKLNEIHDTNHSLRYWRILIGPWLGYFIQIFFDRYEMIMRVTKDYLVSDCATDENSYLTMIPNDMTEFISFFISDFWNYSIYSVIISNASNFSSIDRKAEERQNVLQSQKNSFKQQLRRFVGKILTKVSELFVDDKEAFLIAPSMPLKESVRLQLSLKQIPRLWRTIPSPRLSSNLEKRNWELSLIGASSFEKLLLKIIPRQIPILYLEGFAALEKKISLLAWPKRPKLIFTSNAHSSDDVFKAWAAGTVENYQTRYIIGQHGGHYGVGLWSFIKDHEIETSDIFLTWGWDDKNIKVKPSYALKLLGRSKIKPNAKGKLLIVTMSIPRYSYWMYSSVVAPQMVSYFEDQFSFVNNLNIEIQKESLIRLNPNDFGWCQKDRWKNMSSYLSIDEGKASMEELYLKSRLYISTYNATTFLESMGRNMPTIMFWNPEHWELSEEAIPAFNELKSVGIFHESPESAANKVNEIWSNVAGWWYSARVQKIKDEFCMKYSKKGHDEIGFLKHTFLGLK